MWDGTTDNLTNLPTQSEAFSNNMLGEDSFYLEMITNNIDNLLRYATDQHQARNWLNHLLHFASTLRFNPHVHDKQIGGGHDTQHLLKSIPQYPIIDRTTSQIELEAISKSLAVSNTHLDMLEQLISLRRSNYSEENVKIEKDGQLVTTKNECYLLSSINHSMRIMRIATQLSILKCFDDIQEKDDYLNTTLSIQHVRSAIEKTLEISHHEDNVTHAECHQYISQHLLAMRDIQHYRSMLEPTGILSLAFQTARDFFGEPKELWHLYHRAILLDPELFIAASLQINSPHLKPLVDMAKLLLSIDDMTTQATFHQFHNSNNSPIHDFHNIHNRTHLPVNSKLLAILRSRFLSVLIPAWNKAKSLASTARTSEHIEVLKHTLCLMNTDTPRYIDITKHHINIYRSNKFLDINVIPSYMRTFNWVITNSLSRSLHALWHYFRPSLTLSAAIVKQRHQTPLAPRELWNQYVHGIIDPEPPTDIYDQTHGFLENHSSRIPEKTK